MDPHEFVGRPAAYLAWAEANWTSSPQFCARHWMPCPVEGKPGVLVSVLLMAEGFAFIPADVGSDATALNSWLANQTTPTCCRLGDEKMAWLWWISSLPEGRLCRERSPRRRGERVCWRPQGHAGEHEWERPLPRSVFDLMSELRESIDE